MSIGLLSINASLSLKESSISQDIICDFHPFSGHSNYPHAILFAFAIGLSLLSYVYQVGVFRSIQSPSHYLVVYMVRSKSQDIICYFRQFTTQFSPLALKQVCMMICRFLHAKLQFSSVNIYYQFQV